MQLKYINNSLKKDWENLIKNNPATGYMQSFFWTEFKKMLGWEIFRIGIFENNKLTGGAIVSKYSHFKNFNFLEVSDGPVLPYERKQAEKMFDLLIKEIDKIADLTTGKLSSHLSIEPKLFQVPKYFNRFRKSKTDQQPLKTLLINLKLSEEEILRQMKPKGRYNIKIAQKHKVEIYKTGLSDGLNDFLSIYKQFIKRAGFEGKDASYFKALEYCVRQEKNIDIYFAKYNNKLLSAAMVLYFSDTATFLYGASRKEYMSVMAPYLLHFEIIKNAKALGLGWYDLYGLSPEGDNHKHPWYGFSIFKRKFGGSEVDRIGGYDFIYNEKLYKEYLKTYLFSK
jgi:peptidoglycan pentaglycine glycine transferase (the first glycine)